MNKLRKLMVLSVCIVLAVVLVCSFIIFLILRDDAKEGSLRGESDTAELLWYMDVSGVRDAEEWSASGIFEEIYRESGIKPQIMIPDKNKSEKLDLMIASNNLPDIMMLDLNNADITKLIRLKKLLPIDELINSYVPEFKNRIDAGLWRDSTYDDGKLYGLPGDYIPEEILENRQYMGEYTYNVKKDIYEELGSPDMSTPDNFEAALRLFRNKYPYIQGRPSVPLSLFSSSENQAEIIERSFGIKEFFEDKDENLYIKYKDPDYINVIKFLNGLYRNKLLDPLAFIKKQEQLSDDFAAGRIFAIPMKYTSLENIAGTGPDDRQQSEYIAAEPMKAAEDVTFPGKCRYGTSFTMIPATGKLSEQAIDFIYLLWKKEEQQNKNGSTLKPMLRAFPSLYTPLEAQTGILDGNFLAAQKMADKYVDISNKYMENLNPDYGLPIGRIKSKLEDIVQKDFPLAIMAESENSSIVIFRGMLQRLEQAGLKKLEHYWTQRNMLNNSKSRYEYLE